MSDSKYKRRQYLIKRNFQGKLILGYFLFMMMGCLIFVIALSWLASDSMTVIYVNDDLQIGRTPFMLLKEVIGAHWFAIVVGGGVIVLMATRITHRVAGPLFNIERSLEKITDGQLNTVIYLRKKDEGKEIAASINKLTSEVGRDLKYIRKRSCNISELLSRYTAFEPGTINEEDCQSIRASLEKQNQVIQEIVDKYTLPDE